MALALDNLKRVDMPLNKETKETKPKGSTEMRMIKRGEMQPPKKKQNKKTRKRLKKMYMPLLNVSFLKFICRAIFLYYYGMISHPKTYFCG